MACGCWVRDEDDVAAFRCGDKSETGITEYLCDKCLNKDAILGDSE